MSCPFPPPQGKHFDLQGWGGQPVWLGDPNVKSNPVVDKEPLLDFEELFGEFSDGCMLLVLRTICREALKGGIHLLPNGSPTKVANSHQLHNDAGILILAVPYVISVGWVCPDQLRARPTRKIE